ncbi:ABC transporter ATP-binding protein [Olegusella massiliensis]|uniref:ABC transporter ATP-binding protein n=1 Tax=Olegusella massiliensis TaxID=1776381 RepID=UPI00054E60C1|nr:energy-coupling factor ABC transporter ATP-binding protein [Olegusella massiliensis]
MIEFKDVYYAYRVTDSDGSVRMRSALKDVSLSIQTGEFVVLTGNSGCGKTTACRLVNGLIPHYFEGNLKGEVLLAGKNVTAQPLYETAKRVGSVFQNPRNQFFNVDTTSELAFAAENQGRDPKQIKHNIANTAELLDLKPLLRRNMFALSGGEKQKIACGSVAVAGSDVIVLDEPSSNLDMESIKALRKTLALWKEQGKTVIIAEHRLFFLKGLADRVLVFRDGEIIQSLDADVFAAMTTRECAGMGLRTTDLGSVSFPTRSTSRAPMIRLEDVCFHYSGTLGIDIPDLAFPQSHITAIVGRNGAGKSTLARTLCGLNRRAKGTVFLDGKEIPIGKMLSFCYMVMQDVNHQLFTDSVLEEVLISVPGAIPKDLREKKAHKALQLMDMEDLSEQHPMALSGGQKQRVAIASALAADEEILIFDEPTSGFDYRHMRQTAQALKMLCNLGKTTLIITHDLELIALCADYVVQMDGGYATESYFINNETASRIASFFLN